MALNTTISNAAANAACDAITALVNSGYFDIYDGSQPATPNTAVTSQVKLARCAFGATAFGAAVNGVATANAVGSDSDADATGTAAWFRACQSDGTAVYDGTVGTGTHNLVLATTSIVQHATLSVSALTFTQQKVEV
jgi:hypothetical protein